MTDTEMKRRKAICEAAGVAEIDDLFDGFHTFRQLYYQRMMLFAIIVKQNKDKAWKSLRHEDGELCFGGGWFIVGIDTPEGSYTYHYENCYYSLFDCEELNCAKHWDGHTEKDITRLLSLPSAQPSFPQAHENDHIAEVGKMDCISRKAAIDAVRDNESENYITINNLIDKDVAVALLEDLPSAQPELCEYTVSAMAVEKMLKNLLPERGMWEIEGDEAKTAVCETVRDALEGLWKLPFVKPNSNESSLTQKALDTLSRQTALDDIETVNPSMLLDVNWVKNWVKTLPSAQPEQPESEDITFWEKRAREYEEMVLKLIDEMARGIKINSVLITEEGIVFKKEKPEQRWIPVTEMLPKQGQEVICQCRASIIKVLKLDADGDWYQDAEHCYMSGFVIAWMPLPEPWKEGDE